LLIAAAPYEPLIGSLDATFARHAGDDIVIGVATMDVTADEAVRLPLRARCLMLGHASASLAAATVAVMEKDLLGFCLAVFIARSGVFL